MTLHVSIARADFARGLKLASSVAGKSKISPIQNSVLLRANGAPTLTIAATDLSVALTAELPCEVRGSGSIALNAADLSRFVSGAAGDEVTIIEADGKRADVRCGKAKYRIAGLHDRDFPKMPTVGATQDVDAAALRDAIAMAGYAASHDETRGALLGVMFEVVGDRVRWYTSDGHRLAVLERKMAMPAPPKTRQHRASICAPGAAAIAKLIDGADACRVALDAARIHVTAGGSTVSAGLLDFECVAIDVFMALKHKHTVTVNRDLLLEAFKRVSPLTNETHGIALVSTQTGLALSSRDSDGQELTDEIECEVKGEVKVAAHAKYLVDAATHATGDTVTLRVSGEQDPIVFVDHDDAGYTAVVMPMRMN